MTENIDETGFDPFEPEPDEKETPARRGGAGLAWLALLVAVLAVAGSAYLWWQDRQGSADDAGLQQQLDAATRAQSDLRQALASLEPRIAAAERAATGTDLGAVEQALGALERRFDELDRDLAELRADQQSAQAALFDLQQNQEGTAATLAALTRRGDTPGQKLDMYEVEALLRMAMERLQLFGDPRVADDALALAEQRLAAMDDPVYLSVRQRIARARDALASVEMPDVVDLDGRLAALQASIPRWPFPGDEAPVAADVASGEEAGWWPRLRRTMAALVTVRRKLPESRRLTIADRDYLREGAWLQLETARLALLRSSQDAYDQALARTEETVRTHFAVQSAPVEAALDRLAGLRAISIRAEMPDISDPWSQLRRLRERAANDPPRAATPAEALPEPRIPAATVAEALPETQAPAETVTEALPETQAPAGTVTEAQPEPEAPATATQDGEEREADEGDDGG